MNSTKLFNEKEIKNFFIISNTLSCNKLNQTKIRFCRISNFRNLVFHHMKLTHYVHVHTSCTRDTLCTRTHIVHAWYKLTSIHLVCFLWSSKYRCSEISCFKVCKKLVNDQWLALLSATSASIPWLELLK